MMWVLFIVFVLPVLVVGLCWVVDAFLDEISKGP